MSPPICEALAGDALEGLGGALAIGDRALVVAKIELAEVALKVLGVHALVVAGAEARATPAAPRP